MFGRGSYRENRQSLEKAAATHAPGWVPCPLEVVPPGPGGLGIQPAVGLRAPTVRALSEPCCAGVLSVQYYPHLSPQAASCLATSPLTSSSSYP